MMNCTCPKCSAKIALEPSQVPEREGILNSCPHCSMRYLLSRESFARRAYRRAAEISCARCGSLLNHRLHCPSCMTLYPEYLVAEFPEVAKKRAHQKQDLFGQLKNFSFELRKPEKTGGYQPTRKDAKAAPSPAAGANKKLMVAGAILVVTIVMAVSGMILGQKKRERKQYAESYIMALYSIKLGTDTGLKASVKLAADWKARIDAGQTGGIRLAADEEARLTKLKTQTDKYLERTKTPPKPFAKASENLNRLYTVYQRINATVLNPVGSPASYTDTLGRIEGEFKQARENLKKELPEEIAGPLKTAQRNYKALADF